jgi:hypothetical protein
MPQYLTKSISYEAPHYATSSTLPLLTSEYSQAASIHVGIEALTAEVMNGAICWDITPKIPLTFN